LSWLPSKNNPKQSCSFHVFVFYLILFDLFFFYSLFASAYFQYILWVWMCI
jgi:hypothetical protein